MGSRTRFWAALVAVSLLTGVTAVADERFVFRSGDWVGDRISSRDAATVDMAATVEKGTRSALFVECNPGRWRPNLRAHIHADPSFSDRDDGNAPISIGKGATAFSIKGNVHGDTVHVWTDPLVFEMLVNAAERVDTLTLTVANREFNFSAIGMLAAVKLVMKRCVERQLDKLGSNPK